MEKEDSGQIGENEGIAPAVVDSVCGDVVFRFAESGPALAKLEGILGHCQTLIEYFNVERNVLDALAKQEDNRLAITEHLPWAHVPEEQRQISLLKGEVEAQSVEEQIWLNFIDSVFAASSYKPVQESMMQRWKTQLYMECAMEDALKNWKSQDGPELVREVSHYSPRVVEEDKSGDARMLSLLQVSDTKGGQALHPLLAATAYLVGWSAFAPVYRGNDLLGLLGFRQILKHRYTTHHGLLQGTIAIGCNMGLQNQLRSKVQISSEGQGRWMIDLSQCTDEIVQAWIGAAQEAQKRLETAIAHGMGLSNMLPKQKNRWNYLLREVLLKHSDYLMAAGDLVNEVLHLLCMESPLGAQTMGQTIGIEPHQVHVACKELLERGIIVERMETYGTVYYIDLKLLPR